LKLEVQDGDLWLPSSSLSVSAGARVATRCSTEGQSAEPLSWNKKDPNSGSFVLLKTGSEHEVTQVVERIQLTDSGTYSCNSSAFSTVFELYVYTLTLLQNASIPTRVEYDHIGNLRVVRRNLDQKSYAASSDTWLSCTLLTGGAHLVDLVTVHWEGGLFGLITNQTELNSLYTRITTRNVSSEQITTRLRLTSPSKFWIHEPMVNIAAFLASHPQRMFSPESICMVVPPILRLVYDPPPLPPANFSNRFSCTDPPCRAFTDESNISDSAVVNWTSACEVLVAYPPVLPDGLTWTWTNAHWAAYAVQRVQSVGKSAYLSELKSMVVDKNEPVSPWQILDRRRRNAQALDLYYMNISEQPPGPVVFLCWAKNVLGESAVWWPGPIQDTGSSFWASVWWPVVGVSLELASLLIVVGIFRCCSRAGRLRSFSASRSTEDTSFGLSRLFDAERPADLSYRQQEAVKRTTQLRSPGKVPYVRLSNITRPEADEHDSSVLDQHTGNGARMHCHVNPLLVDDQTEAKQVTDGREGDEYFWDSDTEPNAPKGLTSGRFRTRHQPAGIQSEKCYTP
ncbi:immunoglobulin V-set domain protein, partial [Opisthorchis viverrini]